MRFLSEELKTCTLRVETYAGSVSWRASWAGVTIVRIDFAFIFFLLFCDGSSAFEVASRKVYHAGYLCNIDYVLVTSSFSYVFPDALVVAGTSYRAV